MVDYDVSVVVVHYNYANTDTIISSPDVTTRAPCICAPLVYGA